jgi:hypothetical protein
MTEPIVQGMGYAVAMIVLLAGAFWWGWECRARLAEKVEFFRISNRQWHEYDRELKASKEKHVPLRAQLHDIHDRRHDLA